MTFATRGIVVRRVQPIAFMLASLFIQTALAADEPPTGIDASQYPTEALRLADSQIPELSSAIAACDADSARQIREKVNTFIYKTWNWNVHYERLKNYRVCYQLLSDIAAGTQLTAKYGGARPRFAVGALDANYAACQKLADPKAAAPTVDPQLHWPKRLGNEPEAGHCRAPATR